MSEMAGNKGFDPLGFAKDKGLLLQYREAELKHARLAMLASVGWVMSELWHTPLAELLGAENLLQEDKAEFLAKAPSVLNGGLQNVPVFFWISSAPVSWYFFSCLRSAVMSCWPAKPSAGRNVRG